MHTDFPFLADESKKHSLFLAVFRGTQNSCDINDHTHKCNLCFIYAMAFVFAILFQHLFITVASAEFLITVI